MIRLAEERDIKNLKAIYNEAILNSTVTFELQEKTSENIKNWFNSHKGYHPLLVYEENYNAVGFASLSQYRPHEAYKGSVELSLYVNKDYRGRGIGKKLLTNILDFAKKNENIHTVISVITSDNHKSIALHENYGFKFCGRIEDAGYKFGKYLGIDTFQIVFD